MRRCIGLDVHREVARLLEGHVARVVVSNPQKTKAIAEAKVKTYKVDAEVLAQLLAADYLPAVWLPDEETHALRRQVARRAHIVRQRTRLKNRVQSILHRNLVPRCPAADLFGRRVKPGSRSRGCPLTSERRSRRCCASSTSTARSSSSSTRRSPGSHSPART
jgi:transposase